MTKKKLPVDFVPNGSFLTFINATTKTCIENGKTVHPKALYQCKCGYLKELSISLVKAGSVKSCGKCGLIKRDTQFKKTHGLTNTKLYHVYSGMLQRCSNPNNASYRNYGAKGVTVCDEWKGDFLSFYNWAIENGWKEGMRIDKDIKAIKLGLKHRIYCPDLCSIVTPKENANSISTNHLITYNNETKTLSEWSDIIGIDYRTLRNRIVDRKWSIEDAFSVSTEGTNRKVKTFYNKITKEYEKPITK